MQLCLNIQNKAEENREVMGPHAEQMASILQDISAQSTQAAADTEMISAVLRSIAQKYEEIIGKKLGGKGGASSSTASAGAGSGSGVGNQSLSAAEKKQLKQASGWSSSIVDNIRSMDEAEIYLDAKLQEKVVGGQICLVRPDLDMNQRDEEGLTNAELIELGLSPVAPDGKSYELHHVGQKDDSPLAELTFQEHRGRGTDSVMHDKQKSSEIDRTAFGRIREAHWSARLSDWLDGKKHGGKS